MMKTIIKVLLPLAALTLLLSGCNTVQGVGQDLSAGGRAISHTAKKVEHDMGDKKTNDKAKSAKHSH